MELRQTKAAVPALFELAGGKEAAIRHAAIAAVGKLGDTAACAGLIKLMQAHPQDAVSAMAEICRREATAEPMLTALAKVAPPGKAALLEALGSMGGAQALAAVRAELKAEDAEVRVAAVRALGELARCRPAGRPCRFGLDHDGRSVQSLGLARCGSPGAPRQGPPAGSSRTS